MVQPFERMGRLVDVGLRIGMGFTCITAGMVAGSPISGAIFDATGSYKNMGYYGGESSLVIHLFSVFANSRGYGSDSRFNPSDVGGAHGRHEALRHQVSRSWRNLGERREPQP